MQPAGPPARVLTRACFLTLAVLSETVGVDTGAPLLPYLVGFGAASVFYWWATDDLTVYAAVQASPPAPMRACMPVRAPPSRPIAPCRACLC